MLDQTNFKVGSDLKSQFEESCNYDGNGAAHTHRALMILKIENLIPPHILDYCLKKALETTDDGRGRPPGSKTIRVHKHSKTVTLNNRSKTIKVKKPKKVA